MLSEAGQPEILRAVQRDDSFKKHLSESISEILQSLFGIHFWIKYKELTETLSNVLYQCVTTMSNLQTLGEEYTGMIQIDRSGKSLPKKYYQLLMILLSNFGEKVTISALQKLVRTIDKLPSGHFGNHPETVLLSTMLNLIIMCLPFILKFHKILFYFNGHYYELSKRLCGIKYVLIRYWLKDRSSLSAFKLLGIVTLIQLILGLVLTVLQNNFWKEASLEKNTEKLDNLKLDESTNTSSKCPLCLNNRHNTSVTPCGHLFCWECIIQWLREQPKCPLCRQVFQPSRVVFLQN